MTNAILLCNPALPSEILSSMEAEGFYCVKIPPHFSLSSPIAAHPDILFFTMPDGSLLTDRQYYLENRTFFERHKLTVRLSQTKLGAAYPQDTCFDALCMGEQLFAKPESCAMEIRKAYTHHVAVKQGYAACSTLRLNDTNAITADVGIHRALTQNGKQSLLVSKEGIALPSLNCGFIGGASAVLARTVYFFGNLNAHPDAPCIRAFCQENGFSVNDFPSLPLCDYGSIRIAQSVAPNESENR